MKRFQYIIILIIFIFFVKNLAAQHVGFSQFYSNPLYLNPALTGGSGCPRLIMNYRNHWPAIQWAYNSYSVSIDKFFASSRSGLGLHLLHDRQSNGLLSTTKISPSYAYMFRTGDRSALRFGVQADVFLRNKNFGNMIFPDMIDPRSGAVNPTGEVIVDQSKYYLDFSAGMLYYNYKYYAGIAVHQISETYLLNKNYQTDKLHRKYTLHFGGKFKYDIARLIKRVWYFSPNIITEYLNGFQQINYGFYTTNKKITFGTWFRQDFHLNFDSFIFLLGFNYSGFKFAYSLDVPVSRMGLPSYGAHEISLFFQLPCRYKIKQYEAISCPEF